MGTGRLVDTAWRRYFAFDWNQLAFLQLVCAEGAPERIGAARGK
jgi:hypothetical protein